MAAAPRLQLVPAGAAPARAEQLVLRPVIRFAASELGCPWRVVIEARKPPAHRHPPPPFRVVQIAEAPQPDLDEYRARRRARTWRPPPANRRRPRTLQDLLGRPSVVRLTRIGARPLSLGFHPLTDEERAQLKRDEAELWYEFSQRPETYGECVPAGRPCPWHACRHHLGINVRRGRNGDSLQIVFPGLEVDEIEETCSLRVAEETADRGEPMSHDEVGEHMNMTYQRVVELERSGLKKLRRGLIANEDLTPEDREQLLEALTAATVAKAEDDDEGAQGAN
jgi:hypothetical protein